MKARNLDSQAESESPWSRNTKLLGKNCLPTDGYSQGENERLASQASSRKSCREMNEISESFLH